MRVLRSKIYKEGIALHDYDGHVCMQATAAGTKEQEAMNWLEKKITDLPTLDETGTIHLAIAALTNVLTTEFKSDDIEVGLVVGSGFFKKLTEAEIDAHLVAISESDA